MTATIIRPVFNPADKAAAELAAHLRAPDARPDIERERYLRIRELRSQLARAYAARNGWIVGRTSFHPGQLARRSGQSTRAEARECLGWAHRPTLDHMTFMREPGGWRLPAALVSQPYHTEPDQLADFCRQWGLRAKIETAFPAWYFPGKTPLLVFTPRNREPRP